MKRSICLVLSGILLVLGSIAYGAGETNEMIVERDVYVTMRDGVKIAVDIYRPTAPGEYPVLYAVSPYGKDFSYLPAIGVFRFRETGPIEWYVKRGYAYVHADVRGTGKSREGIWKLWDKNEQNDMYDTIEWIARQSWSNGNVGMIGESYYGVVQYLAAAANPPHLKAIAPYDALGDLYRDAVYHGGILCEGFVEWWHFDCRARTLLDVSGPHGANIMRYDMIYDALTKTKDEPFWWERSGYAKFDKINIPTYSIGNWDSVGLHLRGNLMAFEEINAPKKLLVNDGDQQEIFSSIEFHKELIKWYDHWLKGEDTGIMDEPPVKIFVKGKNEYRSENEWPLSRAVYTKYYLHQGPKGVVDSVNDGGLSTAPPDAGDKPDLFSYPHPEWFGWPGLGTGVLYKGIPNPVRGVLTFITEPMKEDLEVTGPIVLILYASSDQRDTDFCVRITDQRPDPWFIKRFIMRKMGIAPKGEVLTRGWLKASHRELDKERSKPFRPYYTHTNPQELEPGEIYKFEIEIWPISNVFKKGHRIRLDLAPGDSTIFDAPFWHYYGVKMGTDTIYHDAEHPSHLLLPVIPEG